MNNQEINLRCAMLLGWTRIGHRQKSRALHGVKPGESHGNASCVPDYSGSIAAAWLLVEHLQSSMGYDVSINVWASRGVSVMTESSNHSPQYRARADQAARAIALMFLKAHDVEVT